MQNLTLWLGLAGSIIAVLATYAGYLLFKLYRQNQRHKAFLARAEKQQAEGIKQRNANIMESVMIIAEAGKQDQCDVSELSIRLYKLMEVLQGEKQVDFANQYPAMNELYQVVKDMPRGEERKTLAKKERMKLDLIRMKAEARLQDAIKAELELLLEQNRAVAS
ncbi:DUF2489 domain-containing protein [Photobacterium sanctipauli]|uniref:DUF2489 domain-containing protein n=1 Tax=Photobacterium sanctipauli TaxID=1342794 RepID=A0A2T3NEX0_9GAMM|nr:DUF2489 domain-containing protein [Photobacterium sanctipauli]PSW13100.1 DUF2489 domain-containing protein [Photobacterium sanctipauli]